MVLATKLGLGDILWKGTINIKALCVPITSTEGITASQTFYASSFFLFAEAECKEARRLFWGVGELSR